MKARAIIWGIALLLSGVALGIGLAMGAGASRFAWIMDNVRGLAASSEKAAAKDDGHGHGAEKGGHAEAEDVKLTPEQIELAAIKSDVAATGEIDIELVLNGEVTLNRDRVTEIVPLVPGVAREVLARLGDEVRANVPLAVIDSRELADAWGEFLAARERVALAQSRYAREEGLRQKKITSEQEFLESREALAGAQIEQRTAEQKLRTLGVSLDGQKPPQRLDTLTRYTVSAPVDGTIIEKRVTAGEHVEGNAPIFRIAQLDQLWVIAHVYPKDVARVKVGQLARIHAQGYPADRPFAGKLTWIASVLDEKTRTLQVRFEVDNRERLLRAGLFARINVAIEKKSGIVVPNAAVTGMKGKSVIFIDEGDGRFAPREVVVGARAGDKVEIAWGLDEGDKFVSAGAFLIKSELEKAGFEAGHGH